MFDQDKNILEYQIEDDGLHKIVRGNQDPILIPPVKTEKVKYERDFLNPKEKSFLFKNTGKMFPSMFLYFL